MWDIGMMLWRIGNMLDFDAQLDWVRDSGFEAISFHASPGVPGRWRGIDPAATDRGERRQLRNHLSHFSMCEIHAPFDAEVAPEEPFATVERLAPVLEFAGDVGASIVTIHAKTPDPLAQNDSARWQEALENLNAKAGEVGVVVGLELMRGFEHLREPRRANIGITLDVGHMYLNGGAGYRPYGTIGGLVRSLGDILMHVHVHDYNGTDDHIEVGTGIIDFDDLFRGLSGVKYRGSLCLELNPDLVSPEGIRRSREWLQDKMKDLGLV